MTQHAQIPLWDDKTSMEKIEKLRQMVLDLYAYTLGAANQHLLALLDAAEPANSTEAQSIARMRDLISQHPNILSQNCEIGHVTASGLPVDVTSGRVLLILHKKLRVWVPTGGHTENELDPAQTALRESREESNLPDLQFYPRPHPVDFDVHLIPQMLDRPEHLHLDFRYVLSTRQPDSARVSPDEALDMRWMPFEAVYAADDVMPDVKRLTRKAQAIYEREGEL
ncbi:MAG: NUDIX domain-containing protein [Anaerolineaceae bacterium]|nr:MAG: NUDIX domain-containing protein [Anaerolineaceae bacterium]